MKKNKIHMLFGIFVLSAVILSACKTSSQAESQSAESTSASAVSSRATTTEAASEQTKEETTASSASESASGSTTAAAQGDGPAFHMKETENNLPENKTPDPNAQKETLVALYLPSEGTKGIYMDFGSVPVLDAQSVVNQLVEYQLLPENSTVLSYEADGAKASLNLIGIDLKEHRKVVCVANTFIENFNLESITIIAGEETSKDTENMTFVSDLENVQ